MKKNGSNYTIKMLNVDFFLTLSLKRMSANLVKHKKVVTLGEWCLCCRLDPSLYLLRSS